MTLRKTGPGWPHEAAKLASSLLAGGPFMLQKGWPCACEKRVRGGPMRLRTGNQVELSGRMR